MLPREGTNDALENQPSRSRLAADRPARNRGPPDPRDIRPGLLRPQPGAFRHPDLHRAEPERALVRTGLRRLASEPEEAVPRFRPWLLRTWFRRRRNRFG